jgi:hypothetical protein
MYAAPRGRGLHAPERRRKNGRMRQSRSDFKETQVYGWEAEPKEERPSEFIPSTGFSSLSGYYAMPPDARIYRRRHSGSGGLKLLFAAAFVLALGTAALVVFIHYVKG